MTRITLGAVRCGAGEGGEKARRGRTCRDALAALYEDKFCAHPGGYRPLVFAGRLVVGSMLCSVIVLRYALFDAWILPRWDQGWRPWRANALTLFPVRTWLYRFYAFVGRYPTNFGIRRRIRDVVRYPYRMWLYRFYAFAGRHPTNFGICRRIRGFLQRMAGQPRR